MKKILLITLINLFYYKFSISQIAEPPERFRGEGPFEQLIIRGATLINGNGAPPTGPVDVIVENNKIVSIRNVGYPGLEINEKRRPKAIKGAKEINAHGMYLLPGFIDMHGHIVQTNKSRAQYVDKLSIKPLM